MFTRIAESISTKTLKEKALCAIHLQRLYRGAKARYEVKVFRYYRWQHAAQVIQIAYRRYRLLIIVHKAKVSKKKAKSKKLDIIQLSSSLLKHVHNSQASYEEKMTFWRSVLELRRAHGTYDTEVLIKAIIASKGDLNRALVLMGNEQFALMQLTDFTQKKKELYLPMYQKISNEKHYDVLTHSSSNYEELIKGIGSGQIDVVRSLKLRQQAKAYDELQLKVRGDADNFFPDGLDVSRILYKCYYSQHYIGASHKVIAKKKLFTTPNEDLLSGKPKIAFGSLNMEAAHENEKFDPFNTLQSFNTTQQNHATGFDKAYRPVFPLE